MTCQSNPICRGFIWANVPSSQHAKASTSTSSRGMVKLTIPRDTDMIAEGFMNDIAKLMNKLDLEGNFYGLCVICTEQLFTFTFKRLQ